MAKKVVKLRAYKGKEVLLKADGKTPANENQTITLTYNDLQWKGHLSNLAKMGVCKIEVVAVYENEKKIDTPEEITKEIEAVLSGKQIVLTPEQEAIRELQEKNAESEKRNEELQAQLKAFMEGTGITTTSTKELEVVAATNANAELPTQPIEPTETLETLQAQYVARFDKDVPNPFKNNIAWIKTKLEE